MSDTYNGNDTFTFLLLTSNPSHDHGFWLSNIFYRYDFSLPIKRAWNNQVSARSNLKDMGLAYDPNEALKIPSFKQLQKEKAMAIKSGDFIVSDLVSATSLPSKLNVAEQLEAEAKAPRKSTLRYLNFKSN